MFERLNGIGEDIVFDHCRENGARVDHIEALGC